MDAIVLAEHLLKDIRQRKKDFAEALASGSCDTIETYRFTVGQIRGMTYVEDLIVSSMKGLDLDD
tara:strand:- start:1109 stop:1303 length:195 start_codon:yes stop_codon:yes gene_type:complete